MRQAKNGSVITVDSLKKKLKSAQREFNDERPDQPPEVQFLAKQVLSAKQHLVAAYEHRTDHTVRPPAAPALADFPAQGSDISPSGSRKTGGAASQNTTSTR
jgi:hypothetical protein